MQQETGRPGPCPACGSRLEIAFKVNEHNWIVDHEWVCLECLARPNLAASRPGEILTSRTGIRQAS